MRRADFSSEADYYRAHREAFCLAQELGCTPKEAETELARRKAAEKNRHACARLAAKIHGSPVTFPAPGSNVAADLADCWRQRADLQ